MTHTYESLLAYLTETRMVIGGDKKHGQVVLLAGGSASGKSFATNHFMNGGDYKMMNSDVIKDFLVKMARAKTKHTTPPRFAAIFPSINKFDLTRPADARHMHTLVHDMDIANKKILPSMYPKGERLTSDPLPNIMFERIFGNEAAVQQTTEWAIGVGYKPENIHVVWILTHYKEALLQNYKRKERRLFNDVLFYTHVEASQTMIDIVFKNYAKYNINGDILVAIGGKGKTYLVGGVPQRGGSESPKKTPNSGKGTYVSDFKYFRVKKAGVLAIDEAVKGQVVDWVTRLSPRAGADGSPPKFDPRIDKQYPETADRSKQ